MDTLKDQILVENTASSPLPKINFEQLEIKEIISTGTNDHTISLIKFNGSDAIFRHCTREDALEKSEKQALESMRLPKVIDQINLKSLNSKIPLHFDIPQTLAIVQKEDKYCGSIQTQLKKSDNDEEIYPQMMFNSGHAEAYKYTFDRWPNLSSCQSTDEITNRVNTFREKDQNNSANDEKELETKYKIIEEVEKTIDKQTYDINRQLDDLAKNVSSPELDEIRSKIEQWRNGNESIDIDSMAFNAMRLEKDLLRDNPKFQQLNRQREQLLNEYTIKFEELQINELKTKVAAHKIFTSFCNRMLELCQGNHEINKIRNLMQGQIDSYHLEYDDMTVGKAIYQAIQELEQDGFIVDTQGSGNLRGHYENIGNRKILKIQLFDVGVVN